MNSRVWKSTNDTSNAIQLADDQSFLVDIANGVGFTRDFDTVTALVANTEWLAVLNITDRTHPTQISRFPNTNSENYYCVAESEDYVYLGSNSISKFTVLSLSDPENPSQLLQHL